MSGDGRAGDCPCLPSIPGVLGMGRAMAASTNSRSPNKVSVIVQGLSTLCVAAMVALLLCGPAAAATYDLKKQWTNAANPNGVWTMVEAASVLPRDKDWTAISAVDAAYNPPTGHLRQPAFAPGNVAGHYLPAWFKAAVTPSDALYGWRKGDIIMHTTDVFNGIGSGSAALVFTLPSAGMDTLSGGPTLVEDGGANGPGDFVGLDLKVVLP
jgi:hypothetical protein